MTFLLNLTHTTIAGAARDSVAILLRDRRPPPIETNGNDAPEAAQGESTTSATGE
jgi:hypothetical protein